MDITNEQIQAKLKELTIPKLAYLNGEYTPAQSGQTFRCISPIDGNTLADVASCDEQDVKNAVKIARRAFEEGIWRDQSPYHRKKTLLKFADLLEKHRLELAILETMDVGKPIQDSANGDIPAAIRRIRWVAEAIDKRYDHIAPTANNILGMITHEPIGVVGAITPWNFPLYIACQKITPALAVGNSVILKPAEQSPLTAIRIAELATEAGIPPGVINVLPGMGETAGKALALHPGVDVITFTGSTEVGKLCLQYSAQSNMKRVLLECGGKSPNIIMADAPDLEAAARASVESVFHNQGQVCCAPTRLLVDKSVHEIILEKLTHFSRNLKPNNPLNIQTELGALVDKKQMERVLQFIASGKKYGAEIILGGKQTNTQTGGYFIEPTIFADVKNDMPIAQQEIFGPVLSVIQFNNLEEAIQIANDTHYGLAASLWTQDINKAHKMARAIRAGSVSINCIDTGDYTTPFGGYKQSGIGREGSLDELNNYMETKTTWVEIN